MKITKIVAVIMAVLLTALSFAGCQKTNDNAATTEPASEEQAIQTKPESGKAVNVSVLKGPTGMGAAYMWSKAEKGETENNYSFHLDTDATTVGPKLIKGEYDIASIPTNLAANLYKKSEGKVKVIAVNTLGVLYLLSKDNAVSSLDDLRGKTILASGQGTVAEYALNFVLEQAGYTIGEDVKIEFSTEHSESVSKALAGGYDVIMLPEPFVTQIQKKDPSFTVAIDITKAWEEKGNCTLTMGCIAVNAAFYENNKDVVESFLKDFKESADFANADPEAASELIQSCGIMDAGVAKAAIPNSNIVCLTGEEMKTALTSCYGVLLNQNPAIIGGEMPSDDFYII